MAFALSTEQEGEYEDNMQIPQHGTIERWINEKFPSITTEQKQKLQQQLFDNNIKYEKDLIILQGADDKIDEICEICNFDRKIGIKFSTEIANINKSNTLLVLDKNESKQYFNLEQKLNETTNIINKINIIIENKNESTHKLINAIVDKMKLKNEEFFEEMKKYKEIQKNNLPILNELKQKILLHNQNQNQNQNNQFDIVREIENTFHNLNVIEEPKKCSE